MNGTSFDQATANIIDVLSAQAACQR